MFSRSDLGRSIGHCYIAQKTLKGKALELFLVVVNIFAFPQQYLSFEILSGIQTSTLIGCWFYFSDDLCGAIFVAICC